TCTPCAANTDCGGGTPVCDTTLTPHSCVQCTTGQAAQCTGSTPLCNPASDTCVQCLTNPNCPASAPHCDAGAHTCGPCPSGADCGGTTPICISGSCVACAPANTMPNDCPMSAPLCETDGSCKTGCTSDANCTSTPQTPHCDTTSGTPNFQLCV